MPPSSVQRRSVQTRQFENGLVLLAEPTDTVESAAFTLLNPCGYSVDPADRLGLASLLCDFAFRGAGSRDSRALVYDLENLGVERGESVSSAHTGFSAATLAGSLSEALGIFADVVRRPHLTDIDQLEAARLVCLQEIAGVEDEPSQKLMDELRRRAYPDPWGRTGQGDEAGVQAATAAEVRKHWAANYRPNGAILGVAGKIDWDRLVEDVERLFGDWNPVEASEPQERPAATGSPHTHFEGNQCHIGIAFPSVPYRDPQYLAAWAAVGALSDGMSSRLFTEVREKRGLCYTVNASLQTQLTRARVLCYAGTTAERAQETLDVTYAELVRLGAGIEQAELDRLKARIKSGLIMQQESTSSRSGSIARDWYHLGRVRSLEELGAEVDALSATTINEYLEEHPPGDFVFATLGPAELVIPAA
ncbi:MAG TPA: pitrilysin family protein [Lacipirellulaceae bacterium]|nr:pitrilysin family protein [Lacipirellulaceae bacterium]